MTEEPAFEIKEIAGYDGFYFISNMGDVISLKYRQKRTLRHRLTKAGYHFVGLSHNGVKKDYTVACLVAEAFVSNPDPENLKSVHFKDGNIGNLASSNLEWCTKERHLMHPEIKEKAAKERRKIAPFVDKTPVKEARRREVCAVDDDGKEIATFQSMKEAENYIGCTHLWDAIHRGYRKGGYYWKYKASDCKHKAHTTDTTSKKECI